MRSPDSMREMYAGEQPGKARWRCGEACALPRCAQPLAYGNGIIDMC